MTGAIEIGVRVDASAAAEAFARAPRLVLEELETAFLEAGLLLEREIKERTPTSGAGTLRDSIGLQPIEISGDRIRAAVGTSLAYAVPVELGSRPHMPPVAPIREWVGRRLGLSGREADGAAWAIAKAIARRGTPAARMFETGFGAVRPQVEAILARGLERGVARAGEAAP